jgi:hypothetical protein
LQEWIGAPFTTEHESAWKQSRLGKALTAAVVQLAQEWDDRLSQVAMAQMEHRGRRLAAAEFALQRFMDFCRQCMVKARKEVIPQTRKTQLLLEQLSGAVEGCMHAGGFSFFGSRARRQLRTFIDQLAAVARQHLAEYVAHAGALFYINLSGRLEERIREMTFCRQRVRHLRECLEAAEEDVEGVALGRFGTDVATGNTPPPDTGSYLDVLRESTTIRVVLPDGQTDLGKAAEQFVATLTPQQWEDLDHALHDRVLAPLGGLHHLCTSSGDLLRSLAGPLTEQASASLGELLPVTDVAEVEFSAAAAEAGKIQDRALSHYARAVPLIQECSDANQQAFLLVPAGDAGKNLGEEAKVVLSSVYVLRVPGQADLMFCREQGNISHEEVQLLVRPFRTVYMRMSSLPQSSPHSRLDVTDWVPLEP